MHKSASPVLLNRHPDNWDSNVIMKYPGFLESSTEQDNIFVRIISEVMFSYTEANKIYRIL